MLSDNNDKYYYQGYEYGEGSATADLSILLDGLNLPFDTDNMSEFDIVDKMSEMIKAS